MRCKKCGYEMGKEYTRCLNCGTENEIDKESFAKYFMISCLITGTVILIVTLLILLLRTDNADISEYESMSKAYIELESEYDELYEKYIKYNHLYTGLKNDNSSDEENELDEINEDVSKAEKELASLEAEIEEIKTIRDKEKSEYEEEKKVLEQQLVSIKEKIDSNKNEPLSFYAGEYVCGQDFPAGRYMIYDGKSNFFVRGGEIRVNIILGDDPNWGQIEEYVHFFTEGEKIEASSPFKMKLVE